jgi:hypothetical protein
VRAENNRISARQILDELAGFDDLLGVQSGRRLVQNQYLGVVDERLRKTDALSVTLGQLAAVAVGHVQHPRAAHRVLDALTPLG